MSTQEGLEVRTFFVHDFSPIESGFPTVMERIGDVIRPEVIRALVVEAMRSELTELAHPCEQPLVILGAARRRSDAVIIPMLWNFSTPGGIPLEADLELAAYTTTRSHLHLLGRVALPDGVEPATPLSSLFGRRSVAVVRHVLNSLAELLKFEDLTNHDAHGGRHEPVPIA